MTEVIRGEGAAWSQVIRPTFKPKVSICMSRQVVITSNSPSRRWGVPINVAIFPLQFVNGSGGCTWYFSMNTIGPSISSNTIFCITSTDNNCFWVPYNIIVLKLLYIFFDQCPDHVISTRRQMTNLVLNFEYLLLSCFLTKAEFEIWGKIL